MGEFTTKKITYSFWCDSCPNRTQIGKYDLVDEKIVLRTITEARRACKYHRSKGRVLCDKCFQERRKKHHGDG